jgi:hypothetical protein
MNRKIGALYKKGLSNRNCISCGKILERKQTSKGLESFCNFIKRQTCGRIWDDKEQKQIMSECFRKMVIGEKNPNYKGYMPTCVKCNKRLSYNNADEMKEGIFPKYCGSCYLRKMKHDKKGIYPEWLKQYSFKKGESHLDNHKIDCKCTVHSRMKIDSPNQ